MEQMPWSHCMLPPEVWRSDPDACKSRGTEAQGAGADPDPWVQGSGGQRDRGRGLIRTLGSRDQGDRGTGGGG